MKKKPTVSIIIPAFNEEKYISKCLDSISKQKTKVNFETIVVNNNSADKTKEAAKKMGFRVVDELKQGVTIARNTGARVAKGEILVFLDADCIAPPDHIEKIASFFCNNPEVDALGGPCVYHDGGTLIRWATENFNYYSWYFRVMKFLSGVQGLAGGNFAIKRKAFGQTGEFNEKITNIVCPDDLEFAIRFQNKNFKLVFNNDFRVISSSRKIGRSSARNHWKRMALSFKYIFQQSKRFSFLRKKS